MHFWFRLLIRHNATDAYFQFENIKGGMAFTHANSHSNEF